VRVLISTDAGGEGLNLQFCHVIVNFDMPWNPMRIEQRIGRVDRIGQRMWCAPSTSCSKTRWSTACARCWRKLEVIAQEFGVDKAADVMDSVEAEPIFDELFVHGLQNPDAIEQECDAVVSQVRDHLAESKKNSDLLTTEHIWTPTMPASGATTRRSSGWSAPSPAGWPHAAARQRRLARRGA
jgi:superfamily II DNA/RNA helicase